MPADDTDLTPKDISELASVDALAGFLTRLGYPTGCRETLSVTAFGLSGETADAIRSMELLAEDEERFFRVVFVQLRSLTAKARHDIARNLGKRSADHLLILASSFDSIEFVLIDKETKQRHAPGGGAGVRVIPRVVTVERKSPGLVERRILRRLTWTGKDGLDQFDKLRSVFQSAQYAEKYFTNRALFADHYLESRLTEDAAWRDSPSAAFAGARDLTREARSRWANKDEQIVRDELFDRVWKLLGFKAKVNKSAKEDHLTADYLLCDADGRLLSVAFCYRWDRWLDGPDPNDPDTPEENPGAAVVSALSRGDARWVIVSNGKLWRLYSRDAHSRSTNFYEVDLEEAIAAAAETDPNEAFRYWWLFFRAEAFKPHEAAVPAGEAAAGESPVPQACWLDAIVEGSRDYAKRLGDRLKGRIFVEIFPHLARGVLLDRRKRLGVTRRPTEDELRDTFEATLTLLYRLLFLLYAESRDLLPIRESAYREASLKQIKEEIAAKASVAEAQVPDKLKAYSESTTTLYDRLFRLFAAMDRGDALLNVPCYNGGLFTTEPAADLPDRERRIAAFLAEHKVPDRQLALAIDRLARDQDEKTLALAFIDYKSLEVRHLGSIYEGLLEFKLKIADEDLGVALEKKAEKYIPLSQVKPGRGRKAPAAAAVRKGEVYLSNDKAERKATGSYYTPDPIVEYIVEHTVGPVLAEKLDGLRGELDKAAHTYHRHLANARNNPGLLPTGSEPRGFAAAKTYAEHRGLVDRVFDLKVLDPAMGSGHFLVETVDFITDRLLDFLNRYPHNPVRFMLDKTRRSILNALGEQGVTVDPDKLTDINLLKRHILKRCIYGVDLNPMAVELAKVSLWLDAFTLGAPLSFLDHHLRCGNSLIGASFADLRQATSGQLFAIDYEPLLRAINKVLFVNEMADATAAEVHQSADEYAHARKELSGYQIVLDLLVADHFLDQSRDRQEADRCGTGLPAGAGVSPVPPQSPKSRRGKEPRASARAAAGPRPARPSSLLTHASDLDLTTRDRLLASLTPADRALIDRVESVARRSDLRFFHWEIEFPEVFFGFADTDRRQIRYKNDLAPGSAGFDAVVGNPPYVRQEALRVLKPFLRASYATFDSTNDLYVYFQEQEVRNVKVGGRMGMIVANKWMRAGYGRKLRAFLHRVAQPLEVIDFGHSPIFPDADTFPCIPIVARRAQPLPSTDAVPEVEAMHACSVPREHWDERMNLIEYVRSRRASIPTRLLRDDGWSLEDPHVQALLEKIRNTGVPLREFTGSRSIRGILTGFNEAYFVDSETRNRLIAEDRRSAELLKPLLRGRDIDRWRPRPSGMYLITIPSSENRDWPWSAAGDNAESVFQRTFPAVFRHLSQYQTQLCQRQDQGRYWWELRSCDYMDLFDAPKLIWQEMAWFTRFTFDDQGHVITNTAYLLSTHDRAIAAILNSSLAWWYMWRTAQHGKDEVLRLIRDFTEDFPMPAGCAITSDRIPPIVDELAEVVYRYREFEQAAADELSHLCPGVDAAGMSLLGLPFETFVRRLASLADIRPALVSKNQRLALLQARLRHQQVQLVREQLDLEAQLAKLVEDAYGLTAEERQLLRATRPVRDPIDVLEARTHGAIDETAKLGAEEGD